MIYSMWGDPIIITKYNKETGDVKYKYSNSDKIILRHIDTLKADNGWKEIEETLRRLK